MAEPATKEPKNEPAEVIAIDKKRVRKIHPLRFGEAATKRNVWHIVPEEGTAKEDVLDPAFWAHVAQFLRPTDRIEVHAEDGSYFMELYVRSVEQLAARVVVLADHKFDEVQDADDTGFSVKWKGPHHKHAVVRASDNQAVQYGFDNREEAMRWLAANLKSLTN